MSLPACARARRPPVATTRGARPKAAAVVRAAAQSTATDNNENTTPYAKLAGVDVVSAADGARLALRETWAVDRGEKALLVLARSFGCPFCQATAREIARDVLPRLRATPGSPRLVFVGIGTAERARDFAARTALPLENLFADPENAAYDALGLEASFSAAFLSPQTPLAIGRRAARSGGWDDLRVVLDGWQPWQPPKGVKQALNQGGAFLFDGAECVWSHRDAATAAHAEPGDMLERALGLAREVGGEVGADCGCGSGGAEETAAAV